ncbi:hypothetical protein P153DRAFT_301263 [Dothidotthia symphoricarpi CBS 119687]|uniref:Uncharacterized protein n=1 Tax=Dothidotthia symphoricarpi CBS 119687 TaxID=1392245 RepID=A0A6A6A0H9_9PLEO|nr:uncharacterized protein P153DRAFT_301263 [Dothidotthia symphoricarpi CBS 119687]KAF2124654.1 hypothetical protein P153DRAFT_301263 [Dothidotthia symphoricarpi CBS 119687]
MADERLLRLGSLLCNAIATPLLVTSTIVRIKHSNNYSWDRPFDNYSRSRHLTAFAFGFIPVALTAIAATASLLHHKKHRNTFVSTPARPRMALLDLLAGFAYLGVLIPIWVVDIGTMRRPGFGLLAGYTTAPMIVNMFIHFGIVLYNAPALFASFKDDTCRQCPNCRNKFTISGAEVRQTTKGGAGYNLLRGEVYLDADEDAAVYHDSIASEDLRPDMSEGVKGKAVEV